MVVLNPKTQDQETSKQETEPWCNKAVPAKARISAFQEAVLTKYVDVIVDHPFIVIGVTLAASIALSVTGFLLSPVPDLTQPALGFEVRGNDISQRQLMLKNLRNQMSYRYSDDALYYLVAPPKSKKSRKKRGSTFGSILSSLFGTCTYLTGDRTEDYLIRIVLEAESESALTSIPVIRNICDFSKSLLKTVITFDMTSYRLNEISSTSPIWSLPSTLACLASKQTCIDLTDEDISDGLAILRDCAQHKAILANCSKGSERPQECKNISSVCHGDAIKDAFRHILDKQFGTKSGSKRYTTIILPALVYYASKYKTGDDNATKYKKFYENTMKKAQQLKSLKLKGMILGAKFELFHYAVMHDNNFGITALCIVCVLLLFYTRSLFFSCMVGLTLVLSASIAYMVYHLIFRVPFFPFMNIMVVVLLLGVGADDAVILTHCWSNADAMGYSNIKETAYSAFRHAIVAMLVTSVTTAVAFYANILSRVIVMKCFGLFAGTAILFNYILVTTVLASGMVIYRLYILRAWNKYIPAHISKLQAKIGDTGHNLSTLIFSTAIPYLVQKLKWFFTLAFTFAIISAAVLVFYSPGIQLPREKAFQFFRSHHPFEWYDKYSHSLFSYSRQSHHMDSVLVWGFQRVMDATAFDPKSFGSLHEDKTLDRSSVGLEDIRKFMKTFEAQNVSSPNTRFDWIDRFYRWSNRRKCRAPCCNLQQQNLSAGALSSCLYLFTRARDVRYMNGPIFAHAKNETVGFAYFFTTKFKFSFLYTDVSAYHQAMDSALLSANAENPDTPLPVIASPSIHPIIWYNVQQNLLWSMPTAVFISVTVALVTVLLSTRKAMLSILSITSIAGIIIITVGALVLLGWELNIVESVIIILTGGLSFDYTLHYAICYKLESEKSDSMIRVQKSIAYIGCPVFMAAVTTSAAGLCLVKAQTNAYYQIGVFMFLLTTISWSASTFYFNSLIVLSGDLYGWFVGRFGASNDGKDQSDAKGPENKEP